MFKNTVDTSVKPRIQMSNNTCRVSANLTDRKFDGCTSRKCYPKFHTSNNYIYQNRYTPSYLHLAEH